MTMKIEKIESYHIPRSMWAELWDREKDLPLVTPMDQYPQYKNAYSAWYWDAGLCLVILVGDDGTEGYGWCEDGINMVKPIIDRHLSRFVLESSPFDYERIWDQTFRASVVYGRKGTAIEAISAIDIALWDLMGKVARQPVYKLLGGKCREAVSLYASALHPVEEEKVRQEAADYARLGYKAVKARSPCGPVDGVEGMKKNVGHIRTIREAVGPDVAIAADAYMGWDVNYALDMIPQLLPLEMAWIEEPVLPDDIAGYAEIRRRSSIRISGGEHEFTRFGHGQLLEAQAVDILQPDLHRCGGFTEGRKIAAMAGAKGVPVICHTYSVPHIHFSLATTNCPILEHFPQPSWFQLDEPPVPLFEGEPNVKNGEVMLEDKPGLGVNLNRGRLEELIQPS